MLIDDVTVRIRGGNGGRGASGYNRIARNLGPTGANGGKGGSIYLEGVSDLSALLQFRFKKEVAAPDGQIGSKYLRDGPDGRDLTLFVPVGTVITNLDTKWTYEITSVGERVCVAKGGGGGRGNYSYRSSTNTSPTEWDEGLPGENYPFKLELKMIADVGLIGLPNAGKSSLLNVLTGAHSKIGNYAFTTLEPELGAYHGLILADIPGLIEGASSGKGLGTKFLRHIERTRTLFHLISAETEDPVADYKVIRAELEKYNPALAAKSEHVFLAKSDTADAATLKKQIVALEKIKVKAIPLSILDDESMKSVHQVLHAVQLEKGITE